MVDELAGIPYRIELRLVHYLGIWERTLRDEELENVQSYGSGGCVKNL
jgi:hypothetical protein